MAVSASKAWMVALWAAALGLQGCGGSDADGRNEAAEAPRIVDASGDQTAEPGASATFSVEAEGASSFQWQRFDGSDEWRDIGSAVGPVLTIDGVGAAQTGSRYRVVVRGATGKLARETFVLKVNGAEERSAHALDDQPTLGKLSNLAVVPGQDAIFKVDASNVSELCWHVKVQGRGPWKELQCGSGKSLTVRSASLEDDGNEYRVKVAGVGESRAELKVRWVVMAPARIFKKLDVYPLGDGGSDGDGGTSNNGDSGDGDSGGAGGGAGLGMAKNALIKIARLADMKVAASALTDAQTGLVRIKAGAGTAPVLMTLQGTQEKGKKASVYFDEGIGKDVPLGADVSLHALLTNFQEHVGVTPLTEAAYRYAINHYLADPDKIKAGKADLRESAPLKELHKLSFKQIKAANKVILDAINLKLPQSARLDSITALPTPLDNDSGSGTLSTSRYGSAAIVTGGLVADAFGFNRKSKKPALALVEQLARDLTDGKIDNFALDGTPAAGGDRMVYHPTRLPASVMVGADAVAAKFGKTEVVKTLPNIVEAVISRRIDGGLDCKRAVYTFDESFLLRNGDVARFKTEYDNVSGCDKPQKVERYPGRLTGVRQIASNSTASFFVKTDGSVFGFGSNEYGLLGRADAGYTPKVPVKLPELDQVSSVAAVTCTALARTADGNVYSWGRDCGGSLGRNIADDPNCSDTDQVCPVAGRVPLPVLAADVYAASSETLVNDEDDLETTTMFVIDPKGDVYAWGSGKYGLRGDGQSGGNALPSNRPRRVADITGVRSLAATQTLVFALRKDGKVFAWGSNRLGEFGNGDADEKLQPTQVAVLGKRVVEQFVVGRSGIFARLQDGSVLRWGLLTPTGPLRAKPAVMEFPEAAGDSVRHISGAGYFFMENGSVYKFDKKGSKLVSVGPAFELD